MKNMMMVGVMGLTLMGCATGPRYAVVPVEGQGAAVTATWGQAASEHAANNWGKWLTGIGVAAGTYLYGDRQGWFGGGNSDSSTKTVTSSKDSSQKVEINTGDYSPVKIVFGDDNGGDGDRVYGK